MIDAVTRGETISPKHSAANESSGMFAFPMRETLREAIPPLLEENTNTHLWQSCQEFDFERKFKAELRDSQSQEMQQKGLLPSLSLIPGLAFRSNLNLTPNNNEDGTAQSRDEKQGVIHGVARDDQDWRSSRASWYGPGFAGRATANGERFNPQAATVAHKTLPLGTRLEICGPNGNCVKARVNDRGPYVAGRDFDLSQGLAGRLGALGSGVVTIKWKLLEY